MSDVQDPLPPQPVGNMLLRGRLVPIAVGLPPRRSGAVYEVMRVHAGEPIFFDEHLSRMRNSALLSEVSFPEESTWLAPLRRLCQQQQGTQNLQLMLLEDGSLEAHFIESHYPTAAMVAEGVAVGVLDGERPCPHAKRAGHDVRAAADRMLAETQLFEVLLRNRADEITEGSRSNVIFVGGGRLVTPPLAAVLPGITLAKVQEAAGHLALQLEERKVESSELAHFDAAAILGTSPGVLPIRTISVDEKTVTLDAQHALLRRLREAYGALMRQEQ